MIFGVAEDHDSNPIKIGIGKLKSRGGAKFVGDEPGAHRLQRASPTNGSVSRPGTDGLFILALMP